MLVWTLRAALFAGILLMPSAHAAFIGNSQGGTEFPQGTISFADALVDYSPVFVGSSPTLPYREGNNALGVPDYAGDNTCSSANDCTFVSLGDGGSIVLQFVNNRLIGSGDIAVDLWVFEVGKNEDTFVEISKNGSVWNPVGKATGSNPASTLTPSASVQMICLHFFGSPMIPTKAGRLAVPLARISTLLAQLVRQ